LVKKGAADMDSGSWYAKLKKPEWAPPARVFGPVWSLLYIIIAVSFGYVFIQLFQGDLSWMVALPFILNLLFNFSFTPLQFGLKNNLLAAVDIVLVLITLIWAMVVIEPHIPWVMYINLPYLLWVGFATVLQLEITRLNK
jgi:translocator protein